MALTGDSSGFVQSFLLIFLSEIGDKTFFIAGLLAAKYDKLTSFSGAIGALGVMTVIAAAIGQIFHNIPEGILSVWRVVRGRTSTYFHVRRRTSTYVEVRRRTSTYDDVRRRTSTYDDVRRRTTTYDDVRRLTTYVGRRTSSYFDRRTSTTYVDVRRRTTTYDEGGLADGEVRWPHSGTSKRD